MRVGFEEEEQRNKTYARACEGGVECSMLRRAAVAELVYAYGSGPYVRKDVGVRVPSAAPNHDNSNPTPIGDGFGFVIWFD